MPTTKPYHQMTPAERLADRMAKNRKVVERTDSAKPVAIIERQTAVRGVLDKFQQIKKTQGIDAASEFVLSQVKK